MVLLRVHLHYAAVCSLSHVQFFATPWTIAHQTPLSMVFPRQEYWSGLPFPSPGDLPDPGIEPIPLYISCIGRQFLCHWYHPGSMITRQREATLLFLDCSVLFVLFDHSEVNVKAPRGAEWGKGFRKEPCISNQNWNCSPREHSDWPTPVGGCRVCRWHWVVELAFCLQGLEQATTVAPRILFLWTYRLLFQGWVGRDFTTISGALPILATALLFTHWALGESTLLILVKRYQQQGDTTSEHRRLERGTLSASCGRSRKGRTDPLGVANSLLFRFVSHEKGKWYSCRVSDPISGIFQVSVAWSTNQVRCS